MTARPLRDLTIVEFASFVAGPTGGMSLAQLGANVIRIDPLGGGSDHHRWPVADGGQSYYWGCLNKGKRSVALDLRCERGRELALALATAPGSDRGILIDNIVGRRWMAHEVLAERRPDLIHVRLQGHPDGRPAVDYTVNAGVGIPDITGPEGAAGPVNHVLPAWDMITGMNVATSVLAALHDRERTGIGAYVQVALSDVALAGVASLGWLAETENEGRNRPRHGNHVYGSFGVDFATRDGYRLMAVALTEGQWKALCAVTDTGQIFAALEEALDVDLSREDDRYRLRETIAAILRPWFAARDLAQVSPELDAARVLWGRYEQMTDVVAAHRRGEYPVLADVDLPGAGAAMTSRSPLRWDGQYGEPGEPPVLGQDTSEVLADVLGLPDAEIGILARDNVIPEGQ